MSGSAWHFKRLTYLSLKVLNAEVEVFHQKMTDYINFEAEADFVEDSNEDVGDEVSDFYDIESENSFIDDQDANTDANFQRHFANAENDIEQVLKDSYDEGLEDIGNFDEISNLCEGSEDEAEIDKFKNFEVDIEKFKEIHFQWLTLKIKKFTINFLAQYYMLCDLIKQDLKINVINKNLEKVLVKVLFKNLLTNLNLLSIYKNFITCAMNSIPFCRNTIIF